MAKRGSDIECPGFGAEKFDFPELLGSLPAEVRTILLDDFVFPMYEAEGAVEFGTSVESRQYCSVLIVGHADRYDVAGATPEERRAKELFYSNLRAESAAAWLFRELCDRMETSGLTKPEKWAKASNIDLTIVACGAADLKEPNPLPGDEGEAQRRKNRRVAFAISVLSPRE